jgi:hypothetical protein
VNHQFIRDVVRASADKALAETAVASTRCGTVARHAGAGGRIPVIWVLMDGPDTAPIPAECPLTVAPVGARVTVVFHPPHGAICLAPGSGGSGGG